MRFSLPAAALCAVALVPAAPPASGAPPANDTCAGAVVIPDGPFPVVSDPVNVLDATPQGVDDPGVCPPDGAFFGMDHDIWFRFTPSVTGTYSFSSCAGAGAVGSTVYDTVVGVFDSCPAGAALVCNDRPRDCPADVPFAPYVDQAVATARLTAGVTYFIAVGHWTQDVDPGVYSGFDELALAVDFTNDSCPRTVPLALDRITFGSTATAEDDYHAPAACFTGYGQIPSAAAGPDLVYSFTPTEAGLYSFRYVQDDADSPMRSQSPVLYLTGTCPPPDPSTPVASCLAAANRMNDQTTGNGNRSEEIPCVALEADTTYTLIFDHDTAADPGGAFAIEVAKCAREIEPNDSTATATPFAPGPGCFMEGSAVPAGAGGDVDVYDLGAPPAGSKIFAAVDSAASASSDYEMRITTATDTLGYDDNDGTSWIGLDAPVVAGPFADGSEIYARIDSKGGPAAGDEPYRFYARIETGTAQNESLPDPDPSGLGNDTFYGATHVTGGGFVRGVIYSWDILSALDMDCYRFVMREGDQLLAFSDNNPSRTSGTITNVWPVLETVDGDPPPAHTRFQGQVLRNDVTPSPGTLLGVTPSVTSNFLQYRARYTGAYALCYQPTRSTGSNEDPPASAYPLPYQGSISINCGPVPPPGAADIAVTMTGPAGPVTTGQVVTYTIRVDNLGTDIAQDVRISDVLPSELLYMGLQLDDGFGGFNTGCRTLPTPASHNAPIDCTTYAIAPGAGATYTLTAQVANCIGAGLDVTNAVSVSSFTTDDNPSNDDAQITFTTGEDGSCQIIYCDQVACVVDACTASASCNAGICEFVDKNCDDGSVCTEDYCNSFVGCVNDSSLLGDLCTDGDDCTEDLCDPVASCIFPPLPAGAACDDLLACTTADVCDGAGHCYGRSVCDDGLPCTDDFADENNACACSHGISYQGSPCDDGNPCTTGETCDGTGGTVAACNGGTNVPGACNDGNACTTGETCTSGVCGGGTPVVCDDGNPCTDDSCDPASGCTHSPNTAACDDGNACTIGDACAAGLCVSGASLSCDDANPCTDDSCAPATGCAHAAVVCAGDTCHTAGTCNPATGQCVNPAKPQGTACDDNNVCTTGETCDAGGVCTGGAAVDCDDADACTADSCDAVHGCAHALANFSTIGFSANRVDGRDLEVFAAAYPRCQGAPAYDAAADLDSTGCVDDTDFHLFMTAFGLSCP